MMLAGVRVVDLGSFITAPLAAMMLGDLGADVIKLERPEGDPFRRSRGSSYGPTFLAFNRNKRSVIADTTTQAGREIQARLIQRADVVIDNYRPSALKKLGLDPEQIRASNPRLIHCSITGFGSTGPHQDRPAFDSVGQAFSGLAGLFVDPEHPRAFGPTIADNVTGMYAAYAVLGALMERERTGRGRRLEVNMLESSMAFIQDLFVNFTRTGIASDKFARVSRSQCFAIRCSDLQLISVHLSTSDKFWRSFLTAIDASHLSADPRFASYDLRVFNYHDLSIVLGETMASRPRDEWAIRLEAADVPYAPIQSISEALNDPQVKALGTSVRMTHPSEGDIVTIDCPVLADGARPRTVMQAPPQLGEHTREVLRELGLSGSE